MRLHAGLRRGDLLRILFLWWPGLFIFTACGQPGAGPGPGCEELTAAAVARMSEEQMAFYLRNGGHEPGERHHAKYYPGTNGKAVVLVHGFISSPASMTDLAASLQEAGYAVITPLLTGFGDGPAPANAANLGDWKTAVNEAVATARLCHADVSLVAHSLGTALATLSLGAGSEPLVKRVVLLAPYFKSYSRWFDYLNGILSMGTDVIYISDVQRYTGLDPYEIFALENPQGKDQELYLPLKAMRRVLDLQDTFAEPVSEKLTVPALAFLTEDDTIVDGKFATTYLSNRFENAQFVVYPEADKIEHSFQKRSTNPHYDVMVRQILDFLSIENPVRERKVEPLREVEV